MKKAQVILGCIYAVKVSGNIVPVKLTGESPFGGWTGTNLTTGREVRIKSAAKLRFPIARNHETGRWVEIPTTVES